MPKLTVTRIAPTTPSTKTEWENYIAYNNLVKLGEGCSRAVYALDADRVIKINYTEWNQCKIEVAYWNSADSKTREFLAEVLDYGDGWIIMERAKSTLSAWDYNTSKTIRTDLSTATHIGDMHDGNVGYFGNGRFKIIDYGIG